MVTYTSLSASFSVPPLALTESISSQLTSKLNAKLPTAAASIQSRVDSAASAKLPFRKVLV